MVKSKCDFKIKYKTANDALEFIRFAYDPGLNEYYCNRHKCWHVGHFKEYTNPITRVHQLFDKAERERNEMQ